MERSTRSAKENKTPVKDDNFFLVVSSRPGLQSRKNRVAIYKIEVTAVKVRREASAELGISNYSKSRI